MLGSKSACRSAPAKKAGNFRYATRLLALDKGKRTNQGKESASLKACESLLKSDGWKSSKHAQSSKFPVKKTNGNKNAAVKDVKNKASTSNRHEKVVIVSKRSSSVSVVKSTSMRRSVSVKKVSYSTSVVLSSEEDSDSDDDSDDDKGEEYTGRRKTVVKRTTSKIKSNYSEPKKSDNSRSRKKAKALKLLREKLTPSKRKSNPPTRELRPRFPYSSTQEWPTARTHRMASLNALAKVHVLYENEGRNVNENGNDGEDICVIDLLNDDDSEDEVIVKREVKSPATSKFKNEKLKNKNATKEKNEKSSKTQIPEPKVKKKTRKRKMPGDVEIIDTKNCKRMACLNAQAILAASYLQEKPKKLPKKIEKCEVLSDSEEKEVVLETKRDVKSLGEVKKVSSQKETENCRKRSNEISEEFINKKRKSESSSSCIAIKGPSVKLSSYKNQNSKPSSPAILLEKCQKQVVPTIVDSSSSSTMLTTTASKVTQYTEVTKVQINTRKNVEIKEETKMDKHIHENDDVAITQMYHYQSKNLNESYSLQMQATYKPASKNIASSAVNILPTNQHLPQNMKDSSVPGRSNFYNQPRNAVLSSKPYHMNQPINKFSSVMGMDHRIPHQYGGSAFTVPHFGHQQNVRYPHNDYGYYQPAGPLIQPLHDPCTIHKPVPYHPQPHLQQSQIPQPLTPTSNIDRYPDPPHDDYLPKKNSSASSSGHTASSSQQPTQIPQTSMPILSGRTSAARGMIPPVDCNQPPPSTVSISKKQHSTSDLEPSPYSPQSGMRGYLPHNPNRHGFPKNYEQKLYPSKQHHHEPSLAYNVYHHEEKFCHNQNSPLMIQDSIHPLDANSPKHSPIIMHQIFTSHPEMAEKKPLWQDAAKREEPSVMYNPYIGEPINKDPSLIKVPEPITYPVRPPSVIEITEESSRDTKTYIQLEVPKNRFREKIVVVDVESEECLNKNNDIPNIATIKVDNFLASQEKTALNSEIKEAGDADEVGTHGQEDYYSNKSEDEVKESLDVMVMDGKKRKESAVVRRARLHGKQRTFRDCYNRPLAPLVKAKKKEAASSEQETQLLQPTVSLPRLVLPKLSGKAFNHGWGWEGCPFEKLTYISNDLPPSVRQCYSEMKHHEGDVIKVRDCVLIKSGLRKSDLQYIAKITALWENPDDGSMSMSLLWYYRPEHIEHRKKATYMPDELFSSKHRDVNSVACIDDRCYVLTFGEYCRYRRQVRLNEENCRPSIAVVPEIDDYPRKNRLPASNIQPDRVFFCRKAYDFRQKRLLKNPT